MKGIIASLILFMMFLPIVQAVGIGGSSNLEAFFKQDKPIGFSYTLFSDSRHSNNYHAYTRGELGKYVIFDNDTFLNVTASQQVPITGKILITEDISPGRYETRICVREDCAHEGQMCARAGVCKRIKIISLHEGIYPMITLTANNINQDEMMDVSVKVSNMGKKNISKTTGKVIIYDLSEKEIGSTSLSSASVASKATATISGTFDSTGLLPGNYSIKAIINSDGMINETENSFRIGTLNINIADYTKNLTIGGIKKFNVKVESLWNDPIDIYTEISIGNGTQKINSVTPTSKLNPWQTLNLESYIDTTKLEKGEQDITITAKYGGASKTITGKVYLSEAPKEEPVVEKTKGSSNTLTIALIVIVVLLTLFNIILAIYRKKKE